MSTLKMKNPFKSSTMTREQLLEKAEELFTALRCVSHEESLWGKGGYEYGREIPDEIYKHGLLSKLLRLSGQVTPQVKVLDGKGLGFNYNASYVGREFAKYLRARDPEESLVLRVYVKNLSAQPPPGTVLMQLLGSLVWSFVAIVPREFDASEDLRRRNFQTLMSGGPEGFEAGLRILLALPQLKLGKRKLLCVVDGLDLAESRDTMNEVRRLVAVLRDLVAKNGGNILYTLGRSSKIIK
ncbi:hypothetical protein F5Y04DRAFT_210355 [Hypomontagnella monticulosa]|nr:hypothetical protein F5Y04DRAFT_210355 [Hypomontagnella monticulosa]